MVIVHLLEVQLSCSYQRSRIFHINDDACFTQCWRRRQTFACEIASLIGKDSNKDSDSTVCNGAERCIIEILKREKFKYRFQFVVTDRIICNYRYYLVLENLAVFQQPLLFSRKKMRINNIHFLLL